MDFKQFINQKLSYLSSHFKRNAVLLNDNGEPIFEIDLSFQTLSEQFMNKESQVQTNLQNDTSLKLQNLQQSIKICDDDLMPLWVNLKPMYDQVFNVNDQNIGDLTLLKLAELYESQICKFAKLNFANNTKITQIGAIKLAQALKNPQLSNCVTEIDFHNIKLDKNGANRIIELIVCCKSLKRIDLGLIGKSSLKYLSQILKNSHNLIVLGFGEDQSDRWEQNQLKSFQQVIRRAESSKNIFSVNFYPKNIVKYWDQIHELNILCQKRRALKVSERQNQFKAAALNPDHNKYYEPQNHGQNAYKFSVKSYLTNVFGSQLDQALYFLQKQRRNSLREQAIFQITKQPINKLILQDICTADGSILVLAKYLLGKINEKKQ